MSNKSRIFAALTKSNNNETFCFAVDGTYDGLAAGLICQKEK